MFLKVARSFIRIVLVLMIFECINGAFVQTSRTAGKELSVHKKSSVSIASLFSAVVSEKEEREERSGDEREKLLTYVLADFTAIVFQLSRAHDPELIFGLHLTWFDQPKLFNLHCVLLI